MRVRHVDLCAPDSVLRVDRANPPEWTQADRATLRKDGEMAFMTRISGRALAELLPDLGAHPGPRYSALAGAITGLLLDGRVALGTKLPSERELAQSLQLSRATVTSAYDELRSEGLLTSRTGSGSVTALPSRPHPETGSIGRTPVATRGSVERRFARFATPGPAADGGIIDLAVAVMPAPPELSGAAARAASQVHLYAERGGYEPAGIPDLRAGIADRFTGRGVPTSPEQILITNGAQNAIDLVLRLLVAPGERVLTELPTYPGLLDAIRANGARPVAVPMEPAGGWQIGPMTAALRQSTPAVAVLIPDFHNPTGHLASAADRREVLRAARRVGTTIVVDESFIELGFIAPEIPMAALGPDVISIGSISKPVWGGLRVGWVRASAELDPPADRGAGGSRHGSIHPRPTGHGGPARGPRRHLRAPAGPGAAAARCPAGRARPAVPGVAHESS